ncbi:MAG TPA: hypothetical protein VM240_04855 [Verrucomicrobiae bacterium]|nr:hypothetical protein [Verrucomicrobiae bacterium]
MIENDFNHARFEPGAVAGHYESYFVRANHPSRPLAFWVRYTVFSPVGRPRDAIGELWAVWFDGESGRHVVAKTEVPIAEVSLDRTGLGVCIGSATLRPCAAHGSAESRDCRINWNLSWTGGQKPLYLLPPDLYDKGLPKAKSLVAAPLAKFVGEIDVYGETHRIEDWPGSQNHNWGSQHTDRYAWGQVCGFDQAPESFLEVATAQIKLGPIWTPRLTPLVLRHGGDEYALRGIVQALRAHGQVQYFDWHFRARGPGGVEVVGNIHAEREAFVGLKYYNPPGGEKWCLNSKLAACRVRLRRPGREAVVLESRSRAAFEILTDDIRHGVEIRT